MWHWVPTKALQEWLGHVWPHTLSCSKDVCHMVTRGCTRRPEVRVSVIYIYIAQISQNCFISLAHCVTGHLNVSEYKFM